MIRRPGRARAGITLTEILISILIMGVGMISLATLFPLGLSRIRQAARYSRSTLLAESAMGDVASRNLMAKSSFNAASSVVYGTAPYYSISWYVGLDPLLFDPADPAATNGPPSLGGNDSGVYRGHQVAAGPGLTVCYDPLWRTLAGMPPRTTVSGAGFSESRFASGLGFLRPDPDGGDPSAHGLQRLTNLPVDLPSTSSASWGPSTVPFGTGLQVCSSIFVAQDDMIFQVENNTGGGNLSSGGKGSPLVPDLSGGAIVGDFTYTWLFTGRQGDVMDDSIIDGDVVVFHNRPFAYDTPAGNAVIGTRPANDPGVAAGEQVVEAVFAFGSTHNSAAGASRGYSTNDRTVLLRWPTTQPDPEVRVGGWIADVTYERFQSLNNSRFDTFQNGVFVSEYYPGQRCFWYRVVRVTPAEDDPGFADDPGQTYRRTIVTVANPVRAKTLLTTNSSAGYKLKPVHVNAALVSPYVVNVFPKVMYLR